MSLRDFLESLYEGDGWMELYSANPDPLFRPEILKVEGSGLHIFHGRVPLSEWLGSPVPLPSAPITFWGSPVTDFFPYMGKDDGEAVKAVVDTAHGNGSWAVVVKDLPEGDPLEWRLHDEGFVPVDHDPVWFTPVPQDIQSFLAGLSKGRRRGLEGRWRKFAGSVTVRGGIKGDEGFVKRSYDNVRKRSGMRLEELTEGFFASAIAHPSCRIFIFEKDGAPFAFIMLWRKDDIWFDKYMGTDDKVYREVSFYSMSILYLLNAAPRNGIRWYVAGQGCGRDKGGLGLKPVNVRLWIKPLIFRFILSPVLKRFVNVHNKRVYAGEAAGAE